MVILMQFIDKINTNENDLHYKIKSRYLCLDNGLINVLVVCAGFIAFALAAEHVAMTWDR